MIVDPSAASFIAELIERNFTIRRADNDVLDGIRLVGTKLNEGALLFNETCEKTIKEFSAYIWDSKASDRGEDKPIKDNDHAMDAVRYFVFTILGYKRVKATVNSRAKYGL